MRAFFSWVTAHPLLVIFLSLALTFGFGYGLTRLETETDVKNMLPVGYPSVAHLESIDDVFEIEQNIAIAMVVEGKAGIYNPHSLKLIEKLTKKLADVPGIDPSKIFSLFSVQDIVGDDGGFGIVPLCETLPSSQQEIEALRDRVRQNAMFHGALVSRDSSGTLLSAGVTPVADNAQVYFDVMALIDAQETRGETFYVSGGPVVQGVIGRHVNEDMSKMMPLVSVVIVVILLLIFRSLRGVMLPLLVVLFSVIWAMGMMALCKIPIYAMSTIVPIVIMAIGVADGIHILARYYEGARRHPKRSGRQITIDTMLEMASPVIMTSLTTAVGFLSLLTSSMKPIFYTGVFTSVGVLAAMVFSLTFLPAVLCCMKLPKPPAKPARLDANRLFGRLGSAVFNHRYAVIGIGLVLVTSSALGVRWVNVDSDPMANFNPSDPIPISTRVINRLFSGAMIVHTTVESKTEKAFIEPKALRVVDAFQQQVGQIPEVGQTTSVVDFLKMMHRAMNGNDPAFFMLPDTRNLVGTYLMLYSGDNINHYINYGRDHINVQTRVATTSTKTLQNVINQMESLADSSLRTLPDVEVKIGGVGRVVVDLINVIVYGQITSILLSILGVYLITSLMFRSLTAGLFNIVPISMATLLNFGVMAALSIPLEPATAVTSCIGIGVGIDYAIHFIAKYRLTRFRLGPGGELSREAMATAGKAIFFNAIVVVGGFLVLVASQFPPSRHMGIMVSLTMFTSFLAAVTVLPALLSWVDPRFCRAGTRAEAFPQSPLEEDQ